MAKAATALQEVTAVEPSSLHTLISLGRALRGAGCREEALECYREAVRLNPTDSYAYGILGAELLKLRDFAKAARSCSRAIELGLKTPGSWSNFGAALQGLGLRKTAVDAFRTAVDLMPDSAVLLSNLGNALIDARDFVGARSICEHALQIDPGLAEAQVNLGRAFYNDGQRETAITCYRRALVLRPGLASAHVHLGMALLATGQFSEGWMHYEHRLRLPNTFGGGRLVGDPTRKHLWDGTPLPGRTLLIIAEQGLGDIIQFARFLPLVRAKCERVIFRVPRRLLALLGGVADLSPHDCPLPHFDAWCPLMSLPHRLGTTRETIPTPVSYLRTDPDQIEKWSRRLPDSKFHVGIAWQGNAALVDDVGRSIALKLFAPLASIPGLKLISLQKGVGSEQVRDPILAGLVHEFDVELDPGPDAFIDTAAVMASLDLVVTTDTAIAHLAGALGRPAWVALRMHPEWRWLLEREDTPWYPSVRLFRQQQDGDWDSLLRRMADQLKMLVAQPSTSHPPQRANLFVTPSVTSDCTKEVVSVTS